MTLSSKLRPAHCKLCACTASAAQALVWVQCPSYSAFWRTVGGNTTWGPGVCLLPSPCTALLHSERTQGTTPQPEPIGQLGSAAAGAGCRSGGLSRTSVTGPSASNPVCSAAATAGQRWPSQPYTPTVRVGCCAPNSRAPVWYVMVVAVHARKVSPMAATEVAREGLSRACRQACTAGPQAGQPGQQVEHCSRIVCWDR